jgi:hypothetical protein
MPNGKGECDMKIKRRLSRYQLARRLQDLALQIAAGKPIRIGATSASIPANAVIEEEMETTSGGTEIEFEIHWPLSASRPAPSKLPKTTAPSLKPGRKQ